MEPRVAYFMQSFRNSIHNTGNVLCFVTSTSVRIFPFFCSWYYTRLKQIQTTLYHNYNKGQQSHQQTKS